MLYFSTQFLFAQDKGFLEFSGRVVKDNLPLKGAVVTIFKGGEKATDIKTGKNGKFDVFLDFTGQDYKIVFAYAGCPDLFLMIYSAACPTNKEIYPTYSIDVNMFDFGKPTLNYANFKNPFLKIVYDERGRFVDDEAYGTAFLDNLYMDMEAMKRKEEQMNQIKLDMEAKLKLENEGKEKQEKEDADRSVREERDRMKKQLEDKAKTTKENEEKNAVTTKENDSKESMVTEEINLTLEKEKRSQKEKKNKSIKATYENDLLRIVATNERRTKEAEYVKKKDQASGNEAIETLKMLAEVKGKSDQLNFDLKKRRKMVAVNRRIKNEEIDGLIKQTAFYERGYKSNSVKTFPTVSAYRPPGLYAISTDVEKGTFKTVTTITIRSGNKTNVYRKELFSWGLIFFYKDNVEISDMQYRTELSKFNIAI